MNDVRILAVDCATQPKRIGLCAAWARGGRLVVEEVVGGDEVDHIATWLAARADDADDVVLALDAPLGWPAPMLDGLDGHVAGVYLPGEANVLFRRTTDIFVHGAIGKLPLDVGADRIARTAHSALELLHEVRALSRHGFALPTTTFEGGSVAIETYPGGTLRAGPWADRGYKGKKGLEVRASLLAELDELITLDCSTEPILANDDLFDSVIAALGGFDYVEGRCFTPSDRSLAEREGGIWVRRPDDPAAT
jgi:hypothetical protein